MFDKTYVYPILNKISTYLCNTFLTPNIITLISGIPTYYIIKLILDDVNDIKQINLFYFLIVLRFILDCFDGSLARKCNKGTKFGAQFDSFMEKIFIWSILFAIQYKYSPPLYYSVLYLLSILQFRLYKIWEGSTVFFRPIFYLLIILIASQFTKYNIVNKDKDKNERSKRQKV